MKNEIFVNPSLYIGLGKIGTKVILGVKSYYIKQYGEIPPNISFLCFDDDTSSLNESFIEINYNKLLQDGYNRYHQNVTEKIYLTTDEIIDISYDFNKIEIIDFIKNNNIDWLDETILNQLPNDYNSKSNSIVYRQLKRLGFFINYKTFNIFERLKNILNNGCETNSYLNTKYERSESWSFNVYLCSSLHGNTSSSILHDIIFNIKNIANVKILSYLINTSSLYITENKEKQNHYNLNAYATLIELDHIMGSDADPLHDKWWSNYPKNPYSIRYDKDDLKLGDTWCDIFNHQVDYYSNYLNQAHLFGFDKNYINKNELIKDISLIIFKSKADSNIIYDTGRDLSFCYPSNNLTNNKKSNFTQTSISQEELINNSFDNINENTLVESIKKLFTKFDYSIHTDLSFLYGTGQGYIGEYNYIYISKKFEYFLESLVLVFENNHRLKIGINEEYDCDDIILIRIFCRFPACSFKVLNEYRTNYIEAKNKQFYFSDIYFEQNATDLFEHCGDQSESLKWFTVASALGKIYLEQGSLKLELDNGKKVDLSEGIINKTNRFEALKIFGKNKEWLAYVEKYFNKFYDDNGKPGIAEKFVNFYKNMTSVELLGKQFDKIDDQSQEYKNIFEEKAALKEFAIQLTINPEKFE